MTRSPSEAITLTINLDETPLFRGVVSIVERRLVATAPDGMILPFNAPIGCVFSGSDIERIHENGRADLRIGLLDIRYYEARIVNRGGDSRLEITDDELLFYADRDRLNDMVFQIQLNRVAAMLASA